MDRVKLCQINICGLSDRSKVCLEKYAFDNNADFLFVSETKLKSDVVFQNYTQFFKHNRADQPQGGVAIYMKSSYQGDRQSYLESDEIDAVFIVAKFNRKRYLLCSVYIPPQKSALLKKFLDIAKKAILEAHNLKCEGILIVGDLNARHQNWGDTTNNQHGSKILEFSQQQNLNIWSNFAGNTFQCHNGGSRIDLVLSNINIIHRQYIDEEIELFSGAPQRGHVPVWTECSLSKTYKDFRKTVFDWEKTDWHSFTSYLDFATHDIFPQLVYTDDPQTLWNVAKALLIDAKQKFVPTKTITGHSKPFWNEKLSRLSISLRRARKNFKYRSDFRNGEILEQAKVEFTNALNDAKNRHVECQAKTLNENQGTQFWKEFKNTFYCHKNVNYIGTINDENSLVNYDEEKADVFRKVIFEGQHLKKCIFDNAWEKKVVDKVTENNFFITDQNLWYNENITAEEIHIQIKIVNTSRKSMDNDGIHPLMIKNCGQQYQMLLYKLFNAAFRSANWIWNEGQVTLLKKPGKTNYADVGSYRPITISSYVGKLFERILKNRLHKFLEENDILENSQHGFRSGFSTATYMTQLISSIQNDSKSHLYTAGLFVDMQKAFDSVWIDGLLYKLYSLGIFGNFLKIISTFLKNRSLIIKVNNKVSKSFSCKVGVPQGSVLSPTLFAIYINDMLKGLPNSVSRFQYADDTSLVISAPDHSQLSDLCQKTCDGLSEWLYKWRLKANCSKTEILLFNGTCDMPILSNENIVKKDVSKVLGILIDDRLTFDQHLANCKNALTQKWNLVKPFINKGLNIETCKFILEQSIMSKTHYLSYLWDHKQRLSIYQMVKEFLRVPFNPSSEHIYAFGNVLPLDLSYLKQKLNMVRNLIKTNQVCILSKYPNSLFMKTFKADVYKFLGVRGFNPQDLTIKDFAKTKINNYISEKWKTKFITHCRVNPSSGLLSSSEIYENYFDKLRLPLNIKPRVFGGICSLLTGHCNLQLHLYKLKLTYTPCCICLTEDESVDHYLFRCPLYTDIRNQYYPEPNNWDSVANFIFYSGRFL